MMFLPSVTCTTTGTRAIRSLSPVQVPKWYENAKSSHMHFSPICWYRGRIPRPLQLVRGCTEVNSILDQFRSLPSQPAFSYECKDIFAWDKNEFSVSEFKLLKRSLKDYLLERLLQQYKLNSTKWQMQKSYAHFLESLCQSSFTLFCPLPVPVLPACIAILCYSVLSHPCWEGVQKKPHDKILFKGPGNWVGKTGT